MGDQSLMVSRSDLSATFAAEIARVLDAAIYNPEN
jgi:hypothetical protein